MRVEMVNGGANIFPQWAFQRLKDIEPDHRGHPSRDWVVSGNLMPLTFVVIMMSLVGEHRP